MNPNSVFFKLTTALKLDVDTIHQAYALENFEIEKEHIKNILKHPQDKGSEYCTYEELGVFLDGLILLKRGASSQKQSDKVVDLTNNLILKKIRIAMELKDVEIEMIFALVDLSLSKQERASLFRSEAHKNFQACPDELLVHFLHGLDEFYHVNMD